MSLFTNPTPLSYASNTPVEVQQRWMQPQPMQPQQPNVENNAYSNAINELNALPVGLKNDILNDREYIEIKGQLDNLFLQYLFAQALPLVLQNQQHNFMLEKYYQTVKNLKIKHENQQKEREQQAKQAQEQMSLLMQDPVISRRLLELQSGGKQDQNKNYQNNKKGGLDGNGQRDSQSNA